MGKGIDYGMGTTNVDRATGIRYGVIHQNEVCQSWFDSAEPDYGDPTCPKCGASAVDASADIPDNSALGAEMAQAETWDREELGYTRERGECPDYACDACRILFDGQSAFGDEPAGYTLDDGEYKATQNGDDCDIFVLKSPYFTRAEFCSPCAPGACFLLNPCEEGEKAYCFGHDFFEDGKAPYPVYRVDTNELVEL